MNLEADSTSFLPQRPLAAISRASRDGASVKDGLVRVALRPSLRTKLLAAFLVIEMLLVSVGAIGLLSLREADQRANQVVALQHKIEAYRQVQHDTLRQLYGVSAALALPNETTLAGALRQINQFGYDLDRVSFVAKDEVSLLNQLQEEYARFTAVVSHVIDLLRNGRVAQAQQSELAELGPLADKLERLTNQLVNRAEADMVAGIDANRQTYAKSQILVAAVAIASLVLTLVLGHAISRSVIDPVRTIHDGLNRIAAGDFTQRIEVPNRDELGELAAHVNSTCEELQQLYESLEEASRHKSQFLANMSHELRTPLNAVLGFSELLLDGIYGAPPERMRSALERIQRNGRHLLGLINDVLDLSKIEAGQLRLSLADYSVEDLVGGVYTSVEALAAEKSLALRTAVPAGLPPARGDERRLAQALFNLVGNAIKFTDAGEVRIEVEAKGDYYMFSVQDTGPGIDEVDQAKIFEEFQQVDNSITKTKGGAGLGLAIVKRIVHMHGGRIWIESRLGHGARFSFLVPARLEQQAMPT
ncbi:sensor histidine kinase [Bradyrhizobium arachidis]|uniref:sensor histidine kinase n=1 Tax=Bradyrhizobium arachidis TaxID=858423 RepID=UPI0021635A5B|nr:sensor histidine kinase [Bradyrhizobium arachidis]UVO27510.1 HAMP domain-containing protein [Bradyrhizobium arachidis]